MCSAETCGSECVSLSFNPAHCGACFNACGPGEYCDYDGTGFSCLGGDAGSDAGSDADAGEAEVDGDAGDGDADADAETETGDADAAPDAGSD